MVRLEVEKLLLVRDLLQAGQLPLLVVDLVLHELLYRANIVLYYVLVSVDMRQVVDLLRLEFLLLLGSPLLLQPSLLSEGVKPLRSIVGRLCREIGFGVAIF